MTRVADWFWGYIAACAEWPTRYPIVNGFLFGTVIASPIWAAAVYVAVF